MLFTSTDEEVRALLKEYDEIRKKIERNLLLMSIKSDGHLSLQEVYAMPYKLRELYIDVNNEFVDEQNKKYNK